LLQQSYLSEGTLLAYLGHPYDFQEVHLEKVLIQRENVPDTVHVALVQRSPAVGATVLTDLLVSATPFPADPVWQAVIARTANPVNDSLLQQAFIASPYRISDALDSAFAQRTPAPSAATLAALRAAQTGKPTLAQYQAGLTVDPLVVPGYANAVEHPNLGDLLNSLNGSDASAIRASLLAASPLADTVLLEMVRRAPLLPNEVLQDVLGAQPGLSETVLLEMFARSGLANAVLQAVLEGLEHPLTEAVLLDLIHRDPAFSAGFVQARLQQQVLLPESVALALADQSAAWPNTVTEPVLLKQPVVSENVLQAALSRPSGALTNSAMGTLLLKQPAYPTDPVLITMLNTPNPMGDPWLMKVLSASPVQLSPAVVAALDAKQPAMNAGLRSALDYALARKDGTADTSLTRYCVRPGVAVPLAISTITDYEYYAADERGRTTTSGYRHQFGQAATSPIDLKWEPSWQLARTRTYSPQQPGAFSEQEYFYYYDLKNRYDRFGQYYPADPLYGFVTYPVDDTILHIDSIYYDSLAQDYVQVVDTVEYLDFGEETFWTPPAPFA
ncbi:MAG: hypothetical protein AAGB22_10125, partial [Bacteroidota bacterium]